MSTFIKGEAIILSIKDGASFKPIACLTSNSLNRTRNVIEAQTKCEPGQIIRQAGVASYEIAFEGNYIDTTSATGETTKASHDSLMAIMDSTAGSVVWKMDTGLTDTPAYYGTAILTGLNWDNPSGDEFATFSGTLQGSGLITETDPSV